MTKSRKYACRCSQALKHSLLLNTVTHCMMQGSVITFLHLADTLGLLSAFACGHIQKTTQRGISVADTWSGSASPRQKSLTAHADVEHAATIEWTSTSITHTKTTQSAAASEVTAAAPSAGSFHEKGNTAVWLSWRLTGSLLLMDVVRKPVAVCLSDSA